MFIPSPTDYATLFPDLDGLARPFSYELEPIWARLVEDYERAHGADAAGDAAAPPAQGRRD